MRPRNRSHIHFLFFAGRPPALHQTLLHPACGVEEVTSRPLESEERVLVLCLPTLVSTRERQPTCPTACVLWAPGLVSGVGATAGGFGCGWCCLRCHSLSPQALLKDIQAGSATLAADFQPLCCSVQTSPLFTACGHCYVIRTWVLMAVMITDIILTLLITVSVFCLMMTLKRQRDPESERCLPLPDGSILLHTHMKMGFYLSR